MNESDASNLVSGNICVVTVTYGDRFAMLERVVEVVLGLGVDRVVIIDNASSTASADHISALACQHKSKIELYRSEDNLGSAGGYKAGIEFALTTPCEFLWLLDDDNLPNATALKRLQSAWDVLDSNKNNLLLCLRQGRKEYLSACSEGRSVSVRPNSFDGFHLAELPGKLFRRLLPCKKLSIRFPLMQVDIAPYGGLLLHRSWVERIGLPDDRLYLYGDDHDYTSRISLEGGKIFLCATAPIQDLETSWHLQSDKLHPWINPDTDETRLYYSIRNRIWLEKRYITLPILYWLNVLIFLTINAVVGLAVIRRPLQLLDRLRLIIRTIEEGRRGKLGRTRD